MRKKEYIQKAENIAFSRLKYNSPNLERDEVDYEILDALGVNTELPIFVFSKPLNKLFYKIFKNLKKKCNFNLILIEKPVISTKKLKKIGDTHIFVKDEIGSELYYTLEALNVNYKSHFNLEKN